MRPSSKSSALSFPARPCESGDPGRYSPIHPKSGIPACAGMSGKSALRTLALALALAVLSGCSEYLDRRDTIALGAGDAIATDNMTQMVDPWPRVAAQRNIGFNGARMESAVERYRTNRTYPPSNNGTSNSYAPPPANAAPAGPTVTQSAPPPPPAN
jgi:hypothetical protein